MSSDFMIAIHALAYLQVHERQVSSEELAQNMCVNPVRVRKVMAALNKSEIITTRKGIEGGYSFSLPDEKITLAMIYDALHIQMFSTSWRSGDENMNCMISSGMAELMDGVYTDMEKNCRSYLTTVTLHDVVNRLKAIRERREHEYE